MNFEKQIWILKFVSQLTDRRTKEVKFLVEKSKNNRHMCADLLFDFSNDTCGYRFSETYGQVVVSGSLKMTNDSEKFWNLNYI